MCKKSYLISINGQRAVDVGYNIQKNHCYKSFSFGQLEVVLDDEDMYNNFPQKWVDISFIQNVDIALDALAKLGFVGCPAIISEEIIDGCIAHDKEICGVII